MNGRALAVLASGLLLFGPAVHAGEAANSAADHAAKEAELQAIVEMVLSDPEFVAMVEVAAEQTGALGSARAGWSNKGLNLPDLLAAEDGDPGAQILFEASGSVVGLQRFGPERIEWPADYARFLLREGGDGALVEQAAVGVAPGMWLEIRTPLESFGNALCDAGPIEIALRTNRPIDKWSDEQFGFFAFVYAGMLEFDDRGICSVYSRMEDGTLSSQSFSRKGEPYLQLNAMPQTLEVKPAGQSAGLIENAKIANPFAAAGQ